MIGLKLMDFEMIEMKFKHTPVLFNETIESLNIKPDGIYIDGTMGGGGHSEAILKKIRTGILLSIDRDPEAMVAAQQRLFGYRSSIRVLGEYSSMDEIAHRQGIDMVDGILLDIGVSSHQLDSSERGFSYHSDAPLDMRMSKQGLSAKDLVNSVSQQELSSIIFRYGEEKYAGRIAGAIAENRQHKPIETTFELAEIVKNAVPAAVRRSTGHPARKTFQAIRIVVNDELGQLEKGLKAAFDILDSHGRLAVITFHSLEDRIVKQQMNLWCEGCICPKDFPVCVCGQAPKGRLLYKRGLTASAKELEKNPRARSARLRVFEKY